MASKVWNPQLAFVVAQGRSRRVALLPGTSGPGPLGFGLLSCLLVPPFPLRAFVFLS